MPVTDSGLPFSGSIDVSRHASHQGAEAAKHRAPTQLLRYLALLVDRFPEGLTDAEAAVLLGVERSTINARRGECFKAGLVRADGLRKGNYETDNTVWTLAISRIP